jgi:glycosyltransferase involved in cell wall biosynthesis
MLSYIQNSPNKDKIRLLVNIYQDEMFSLYTQAQIFSLHSQEESQGIALVEAMATGLPIVATQVGGIPYVVTHEKTGLLSDYSDVQTYSCNLHQLLYDANFYNRLVKFAKRDAKQYLWGNIASLILDLYKK